MIDTNTFYITCFFLCILTLAFILYIPDKNKDGTFKEDPDTTDHWSVG